MAAYITYSDGRPGIICESTDEAVEILGRECQVVEEFDDRWLAWKTEELADNDDGANATAQITSQPI